MVIQYIHVMIIQWNPSILDTNGVKLLCNGKGKVVDMS